MWLLLLSLLILTTFILFNKNEQYTHPVLKYQYASSKYNHPANYGDPIRPGYVGTQIFY